jgi:glycosyltransferase involved in cell wall biosynthesis
VNNRITLLTCTGGRPEAFALCEKWMSRQTIPAHEWIVVDDCEPRTVTTMGQTRIEPRPVWSGVTTLGRNLAAGLERVTGDSVAFIEDDDYYAPTYIEKMRQLLDMAPLVGEGLAKYYNARTRSYTRCCNATHASLAGTVCRSWYIPRVVDVIKELGPEVCCDMTVWKAFEHSILSLNSGLYVGIKGLPGRPGIAGGHRDGLCNVPDPDMATLYDWIGEDAKHYEHFSS